MEKRCSICSEIKPLILFYKKINSKDGLRSDCRKCCNERSRKYRLKNKDKIRDSERIRHQTIERKQKCLEYYQKNKGNKVLEYMHQYRLKNKDKISAHNKVSWAIASGSLIRKPCEICGAFIVDAHHEDYLKPLEVNWLCKTHHKRHHLGEK
jgi:hypothetical protein